MKIDEAIEILKRDRDLYNFNPWTGDRVPISDFCKRSAEALDLAISALENQEKRCEKPEEE